MTISAKVVADSICGTRLITLELRYPRFIHAEFMTHRVFSRNASSSRAIPVKRLIATVIEDMAAPVHWGKNQSGMQAREELTGWRLWAAKTIWKVACSAAVMSARLMSAIGGHKQIVNRLIEPFSHITVLCSSTEWENFFNLRDHPDADPTIQVLARTMKDAIAASTPQELRPGEWHLPYTSRNHFTGIAKQLSAARCARVSYLTHEGAVPNPVADCRLYDKLAGSDPQHLSPTEHQATPSGDTAFYANFRGWIQFRREVDHAL